MIFHLTLFVRYRQQGMTSSVLMCSRAKKDNSIPTILLTKNSCSLPERLGVFHLNLPPHTHTHTHLPVIINISIGLI